MALESTVGFIGFGEAGFHIAKGLGGAGLTGIRAYDINTYTPVLGEKIRQRSEESGVLLLDSPAVLASECNVLISTVTADRAMEAVEQTAPFLKIHHIYVDFNSISPALKQSIGRVVSSRSAKFVEGAIMSPVARHSHRVPILLGGRNATALVEILSPYEMNLDVISDQIGAASATKMCRSIVVKGLEALMLECVLAAVPYGADERVFGTLDESLPGVDWKRLASYMVGRVVEHGERRAMEMKEVADTLRTLGIEPIMAQAAAERQLQCARLGLLEGFGGKPPDDYKVVVRAISERVSAANKGGANR
ncbi:MAG TPA: DUF1932 domain-containing protein [Blastocatellia bacterium]|nr:DUF1932 domain-containing protein [Blastocatellia bacterium]